MLKKIIDFLHLIVDDVLLLLGVFFLSYGVFSIYVPAGHIILGACFIAIAYLMAKRKGPQ